MTRLFIENHEIELDKDVQFAITKQFLDLTNPTTIISDWSKTVNIPFTLKNNLIFGDLYNEDRVSVDNNILPILEHTAQFSDSTQVDWKTNSLVYQLQAPYFNLYGVKVQLASTKSGLSTHTITVGTYPNEGIVEGTFTIPDTYRTYKNQIIFCLDSTPFSPGLVYTLPEDIYTFAYKFDISLLDKSSDIKRCTFGNIILGQGQEISYTGIYFDPLKKLDFRLLDGDNVIMTGYAKTLSVTLTNGKGTYNITLNGQLGKILRDIKNITFDTKGQDDDKYAWNTDQYIKFNMDRYKVKQSWDKVFNPDEDLSLKTNDQTDYKLNLYLGFAPSNTKDEGFDYTTMQIGADLSDSFEHLLASKTEDDGTTFYDATGIRPEEAIPDGGFLPGDVLEFRSYLQLPFIMWNKFFQMFCKKVDDLTGYKTILDKTWFNKQNPYWRNLVMMLNKPNIKEAQKSVNMYELGMNPTHSNWNQDPGYGPKWTKWFSWRKEGTSYKVSSAATLTTEIGIFPISGIETLGLATYGEDGYWTIPENAKVRVKSSVDIAYKVKYYGYGDEGRKLVPESEWGTYANGTFVVDPYGLLVDAWRWTSQGADPTGNYENYGKFPALFSPGSNDNLTHFVVLFGIILGDGTYKWIDTQYYFTKDLESNKPINYELLGIPEDKCFYIPEDNCYAELGISVSTITPLYARTYNGYTFKIPYTVANDIKSTDLLSDGKFKLVYRVLLVMPAGWSGRHYIDSSNGFNNVGYLMFKSKTKNGSTIFKRNFVKRSASLSKSSLMPESSELNYLSENDRTYFEFENGKTTVQFDVMQAVRRSGFTIHLKDLWDNDKNIFDTILNYCKMYRIGVFVNDFNKTIEFKPLSTYFSNYKIEDWTDKVDKSRDYTIEPVSFNSHNILFNYKDANSLLGKEFKKEYGFNFGEKNIITNYEFDNNTTSLFKDIPTSISYSDVRLSWNLMFRYFNYRYTTPEEVFPYSLGEDHKHNSMFGQFFFFKGARDFDYDMTIPLLTDDTLLQNRLEKYFYTYENSAYSRAYNYAYVDIYDEKSSNGMTNYCTFGVPLKEYTNTYSGSVYRKGIYENLWEDYINEAYSRDAKKITCYIRISLLDYINFEFNKFIRIDNNVYLVNKIYDYNTNNESTKVELIKVNNIGAYSYNDFISSVNNMTFKNIADPAQEATIDVSKNVFSEIAAFSCDYDIYNNCMIFGQNIENVKDLSFSSSNIYQDSESGLKIEIKPDNKIYITGYKAVSLLEEEVLAVNIYLMNNARNYTTILINRS